MVKKQIKKSDKKTEDKQNRSSIIKIAAIALAVVVIGYFVYDYFIKSGEPKVEYYKFTKEGELTFTDSLGTLKAKIDLEIADTEYERELGLMNRNEMKENEGMLFIFPEQKVLTFWMRNTLISLDMLFVNDQKKIVMIHKYTKTLSDQSYSSTLPAKYVVEVVAGYTDKHNITVGDKINWIGTNPENTK